MPLQKQPGANQGAQDRERQPRTPPPPVPPIAPRQTDEEKVRDRLARRADELRQSHWATRVCERGHVIETHRASHQGLDLYFTCPLCGASAKREAPEQTALREHRVATSLGALRQRMWDALENFAHQRLNAQTWTQQSDAARAARTKAEQSRDGQRSPFDL